MAALPVEVLLGIYLGLLTGFIPALVAWSMGFVFKYFTGVTVPALAVVVLGVAIAGVNGGLLALVDPTITTLPNSERVVVAILVVMMMSLYAHAKGDQLGETFPHRITLRSLRERTLSADVVELVGVGGQVRVTVAGDVGDIEGYPPLPADLRATIRGGEWPFPADLPLPELERRLEDRLRSTYDLAEVSVTIDERGRAHIAAAPGTHGVSARVPAGQRAASFGALVPTGMARGEAVTIVLPDGSVDGTLVSARSTRGHSQPAPVGPPAEAAPPAEDAEAANEAEAADEAEPRPQPRAATTDGGDGRVTVAVRPADARRLLRADRGHVVVRSRGVRGEFELLAVLQRAGAWLRKIPVGEASALAGATLAEAELRDTYEVEILAVRTDGNWTVTPPGRTRLTPGAEVFVAGTGGAVDRFAEAAR